VPASSYARPLVWRPAGITRLAGYPRRRPAFTPDWQPDPSLRLNSEDLRTLCEMARKHAAAVIATLVGIMEDPSAPGMARVLAADKLADRIEGGWCRARWWCPERRRAISLTRSWW
jgi:hypothetical protein